MIKIICDDEMIVTELGDKQLAKYRGVIRLEGDKELVEIQFSNVLLEIMKTAPELLEGALEKATEALEHDKSN